MLSECANMRGGSCWSGAKGRLRSRCGCEGPPAGDSTRVTERLLSLDRASSHSLFTSSMVCLVLHAPVVSYFSRCLCQTVPVFFISTHTAIAPQLSPALSPFSLFFFSCCSYIYSVVTWAGQHEPFKMIVHHGSTESQNLPFYSLISFLLVFNYPFTFLTAAVGLAETFLNTRIVFLSGNSSGPAIVQVKLYVLKLSLLLCTWWHWLSSAILFLSYSAPWEFSVILHNQFLFWWL